MQDEYIEGFTDALDAVPIVSAEYATLERERDQLKARIAELEKELLERGTHNSDCPISWKGECYCGWQERKQSLMER